MEGWPVARKPGKGKFLFFEKRHHKFRNPRTSPLKGTGKGRIIHHPTQKNRLPGARPGEACKKEQEPIIPSSGGALLKRGEMRPRKKNDRGGKETLPKLPKKRKKGGGRPGGRPPFRGKNSIKENLPPP